MVAITKNLSGKLYVELPAVPIYHALPKIHKETFPPPLRPIVEGNGSILEHLSDWVYHYLQPFVTEIPG